MTRRRIALSALAAVVAALVVVLLTSGGDQYRVRLQIPNAGGLFEGSDVRVGGASVGKVASLDLGPHDVVVADLEVDPAKVTVGHGASAAVKAANLLGEKFVQLNPGERSAPRASGTVIPPARVSFPVDLDQVLAPLDADTRTRLAIMVNEAGIALTGRRTDFNAMLHWLPRSLDNSTALLGQVTADDRALAGLVERSDGLIARFTAEREDLGEFVQAAGETMRTVGERRTELRETLARAPGTLTTLQRFLADLRATTVPLGPAARGIRASTPELTSLLAQLEPFRDAAEPALEEATAVAPSLAELGSKATPVVRQALPTLRALATFAQAAPPLTRALDAGIDDALGAVQGWARAIQGRDSVGHVFRGHISMNAELLKSLVRRLTPPARSRRRTSPRTDERPSAPGQDKQPPRDLPGQIGDAVDELTDRLPVPSVPSPRLPDTSAPAPPGPSTEDLLDYLLG